MKYQFWYLLFVSLFDNETTQFRTSYSKDKYPFILHFVNSITADDGDARNQPLNSQGIALLFPECSALNPIRVKSSHSFSILLVETGVKWWEIYWHTHRRNSKFKSG